MPPVSMIAALTIALLPEFVGSDCADGLCDWEGYKKCNRLRLQQAKDADVLLGQPG